MAQYTDQLGRTVMQLHGPTRIISLVPSLTELLYHLQLEKEVAGITRFCVHPAHWLQQKTRVGGTKQVSVDQVRNLQPDLVIASKEENIKEQIEAIATFAPVWVSDIQNLPDALEAIDHIGVICNRTQIASALVQDITAAFDRLSAPSPALPVAYLIWKNPYMTIGGDTFIHDILYRCGLQNVFGHRQRYPEITVAMLRTSGCRVVLLSSEPYPFREQHLATLQQQLPDCKIVLVDGEMFSWYGSRLLEATTYFAKLLADLH